ncbi:MAG: histidine--tRNA ligase [bacterium]|nr:histidine--tRNA ligase [bacterium]
MAKIVNISGFPEWLPQQKIIEDRVINTVRSIYESHGFAPIETRSVELLSTLSSKGEINKEVYTLQRAQSNESEQSDSTLALHFDLTIPFARYVAQNFSELDFPFKRYQLQKSWRGERPQEGRFREFYQFDVDVVSIDDLPLCHDAEMITIIYKALSKLKLGEFKIKVNNRKLLLGIYEHFGLSTDQRAEAVIIVDKILKIGADLVITELKSKGVSENVAQEIVKISKMQLSIPEFLSTIDSLGPCNETFKAGVTELRTILDLLIEEARENVVVDLSLARGLDYYTGTIIETVLTEYTSFGSIAGGGRYENLTERFSNKRLPGVGISIGITRLMSLIIAKNLIEPKEKCPTQLLITLNSEPELKPCIQLAERFRTDGISVEIFHKPSKLGKQIDYADKKGIRFVLFQSEAGDYQIKDLLTKEQKSLSVPEIIAAIKTG